jgi:hypothetical protein
MDIIVTFKSITNLYYFVSPEEGGIYILIELLLWPTDSDGLKQISTDFNECICICLDDNELLRLSQLQICTILSVRRRSESIYFIELMVSVSRIVTIKQISTDFTNAFVFIVGS